MVEKSTKKPVSENTYKQIGAKPSDANVEAAPVDPVVGKTVSEILGEIVWLMTQDASSREMTMADVERLVLPAILLRQFHIQYAHIQTNVAELQKAREATGFDQADSQNVQPISVEIFAMVSDAVDAALDANPGIALTVQDWRSGSNKRVMASFSIRDKLSLIS